MADEGTDTPLPPPASPAPSGGVGAVASLSTPEFQKRYIHSDIYDRLVEGDDDLPGLVAYGLYQAAKRRWITAFEERHHRTPSEAEVKEYCFTFDSVALGKLRNQSYDLIFQVTEERLVDRIEEMAEDAFNARAVQELGDLHKSLRDRTGLRHHILAHIAGFFVIIGLFALVLLAVHVGEPLDWVVSKLGFTK